MSLRIGQRCRVRCLCEDNGCLARASRGGATGKVVDMLLGLTTVLLDNHEELNGIDFPSSYVTPEDS